MTKRNRPMRQFTAGCCLANIWHDEVTDAAGRTFSAFTVRLERRYQDAAGNWQSAGSFRRRDLGDLSLVVNEAYRFISLNEKDPSAA